MTTTTEPTISESGTVKCECGSRFFRTQRHVCDFYDNSGSTIDPFAGRDFDSTVTRPSDNIDPPEHNGGVGTGHRANTRSNRYSGNCIKCGGRVEAEAGYLVKDNSKTGGSPWGVEHKIGECQAETVAAPAPAPVASGSGMSEAQEGYLRSLLARKQPEADADGVIAAFADVPNPRKLASAMIDTLKDLPDAPKPKAPAVEVDTERRGDVHFVDGEYFRVHIAQNSGRLYACVWDEELGSFEYVTGMIGKLNNGNKVTAEQAAAFGKMYGRCCYCSRAIDTPESTEVGYGPICARKQGLPWG